jgi:hypothetical protein
VGTDDPGLAQALRVAGHAVAGRRPGSSSPRETTRANQTPAAPHAPATPGAASADAGSAGDQGDPDGDGVPGNASGGGRPDTVPSTVPEPGNADEADGD